MEASHRALLSLIFLSKALPSLISVSTAFVLSSLATISLFVSASGPTICRLGCSAASSSPASDVRSSLRACKCANARNAHISKVYIDEVRKIQQSKDHHRAFLIVDIIRPSFCPLLQIVLLEPGDTECAFRYADSKGQVNSM